MLELALPYLQGCIWLRLSLISGSQKIFWAWIQDLRKFSWKKIPGKSQGIGKWCKSISRCDVSEHLGYWQSKKFPGLRPWTSLLVCSVVSLGRFASLFCSVFSFRLRFKHANTSLYFATKSMKWYVQIDCSESRYKKGWVGNLGKIMLGRSGYRKHTYFFGLIANSMHLVGTELNNFPWRCPWTPLVKLKV